MPGALNGLRIIDLTRVLAGPVCTQTLGDLGADVIKVEQPGKGDETRNWGPPFLKDENGNDTGESAYYLAANRNKRSVTIDLATESEKIHALLANADVLIENFKAGGLEKYGLSYAQIKDRYPRLIYCSITGFGQNGPMADEPGYDFMIQGLSGFMSLSGPADGNPSKAAIAIVDYVTGQNAAVGILAALRARDTTGRGQHVDIALLDTSIAMMTNLAQYALTSGNNPPRVGNAHTTIVPYNAFAASDGWIILAIGNDGQFEKFCHFAGRPDIALDARFKTNIDRVRHRDTLTPLIAALIAEKSVNHWTSCLPDHGVPCGPVNSMLDALALDQVKARHMVIEMTHPLSTAPVRLVGSPLKLSENPVTYRHAPPTAGQHNDEVL
jgi:crotonobetainyl-CoA:carnitine CoA-transferase CaiB-like acyl-CoA transferase